MNSYVTGAAVKTLREKKGLTQRQLADRIAVMHQGRIVEEGNAAAVVGSPKAPYTRALLASIPHPDPERSALADLTA